MKKTIVILLFSLCACGRSSSPEGRSKIRDESIQMQFDSLKSQNKAILDSFKMLKLEMRKMKQGGL